MRRLLDIVRERQADVSVLLFFAAGVIGIYTWAVYKPTPGHEMVWLAQNIAKYGTFANPFSALATGPTAANPPLYPLILAGLIRLLPSEPAVNDAVVLVCILANAVSAALLPRISLVFFQDIIPGVVASLLWMTVMPMLPGWDTSLTAAGVLLFILLIPSAPIGGAYSPKHIVLAGVICGLLFLLNPSSLLVTLPWTGYLLWRARPHPQGSVKCALTVLTISAVFIVGWCARNYLVLGAFVVRTNLGMTLYAPNNDCAKSSMFWDRMSGCFQAHHPNENVREAELVRTLGEAEYDRMRIADTKKWIESHRRSFLELTARRAREFWFPATKFIPAGKFAPEEMVLAEDWGRQQNRIAYAIWGITCFSIPGLILMAWEREPVMWFVLVVLATYPLMYYVVVSDVRYRYPVLWLSLLCTGYFLRVLIDRDGPTASATQP